LLRTEEDRLKKEEEELFKKFHTLPNGNKRDKLFKEWKIKYDKLTMYFCRK